MADRVIPAGRDLEHKTGLAMSTIRREQEAGRFPPFRQLSPGRVGCLESEVDEWLRNRPLAALDNGVSTKKAGPGRGHRRTAEAAAGA
jgi:predicted DNA-binding transcriptional regulator AlpA